MDGDIEVRRLRSRVARLEARVENLEQQLGQSGATKADEPDEIEPIRATPAPRPDLPPAPPVYRAARPMPTVPAWTPQPSAATLRDATPAVPTQASPTHTVLVSDAPTPAPAPAPSLSLRDIEERFGARALAWIGALALVAAAIFFLSLAFSRGWITEPMRVAIGFVVAASALGIGALSFDRRNPLLGNVLTAAGLGIASITLYAATRGYGLLSPDLGLLAALVAAVAAAAIAIRYDAREVAVFGLIAALVAPPLMGAAPTTLTLLFVAVTLVGTTAIALFRSWRWLPSIAFVLSAPQLASWLLGDVDTAQGLIGLAGFWLVNIVAAGGEEFRIRRDDLQPSTAMLVLANAAYLTWGGNVVLQGPSHVWLGTFIALASLAHLAVGVAFLRRQGLEHLFGNLVAGTGVALLALAAFEQLGAALVPVAWAAEAVALGWLAVRRLHVWSALAAVVLGCLAICHLLVVEYPLPQFGGLTPVFAVPFLHPEDASLAAVVAALGVACWFTPVAWIRSAMVAIAGALLGYAAWFEARGPLLAATLVVIALAALELDAIAARTRRQPQLAAIDRVQPTAWYGTIIPTAIAVEAIAALVAIDYAVVRWFDVVAVPYVDAPAASLAIVLAGLAAAGLRFGTRPIRSVLSGIGVLLILWSVPFELDGVPAIAAAAVLLPLAVIVDRGLGSIPDAPRLSTLALPGPLSATATAAGALAWLAALEAAMANQVERIFVGPITLPPMTPFFDEAALTAVVLAGAAVAAAAWATNRAGREVALLAAIVPMALVAPFEVEPDMLVVVWLLLAGAALVVTRPSDPARFGSLALATMIAGTALVVAFVIVAAPVRLWVVDPSMDARAPLLGGWWVAIAAVAASTFVVARRVVGEVRAALEAAAAGVGVYLVSIAVVDAFQRQAGTGIQVEELAKQAQVALSVTWTGIGVVALAAGLRTRVAMPRHIGFGLLALATTKVFVVDLGTMDVAYRALVLAGLGVLLLLSAWLYTHLRGPRAGASGLRGARPA